METCHNNKIYSTLQEPSYLIEIFNDIVIHDKQGHSLFIFVEFQAKYMYIASRRDVAPLRDDNWMLIKSLRWL